MGKYRIVAALAGLLSAPPLVLGLVAALAQAPAAPLKPLERFDGTLRFRAQPGEARAPEAGVRVDNWIIDGRQKIDRFPLPAQGFVIVQLRGGTLTTTIDGKRERRREGAFWTVPPGATMAVETGDDSAVIQTVIIVERP
jgi:quercetin dioxygenase-like cupin family protein